MRTEVLKSEREREPDEKNGDLCDVDGERWKEEMRVDVTSLTSERVMI